MPDIMLFQSSVRKEPVLKQESARAEDTAVYQVGGALKDLGKAVLDIENRNQTLKARADMAEVQAKMSGWFAERAASGNVESLTEDMQKQLGKELSAATRTNRSAYYAQAVDDAKPALIASFLSQAEQAKIEGTFLENAKACEKIIDAQSTFVLNNPDKFKEAAQETAAAVNAAVLPAAEKDRLVKRAGRGYSYISMQNDLQENPNRLRENLLAGEYAEYMTPEEQMNYLSGAENKILESMLAEPQKAREFMKKNPDWFKTIKKETALKKIENMERVAQESALQTDRLNRSLQELDFWQSPTQAKIDAFDFRGNEEKRKKWEDALAAVPNPNAETDFIKFTDFGAEIEKIAAMPDETKEQQGAIISKAADVLAQMMGANQNGKLEADDFAKHKDALSKIAQDKTIRADFKKAMPSLAKIEQAMAQVCEATDPREKKAIRRAVADSRKNLLGAKFGLYPQKAQRILADGFSAMLTAAANGKADAADGIYRQALSDALNVMFPAFAGKQKGDLVDLGDGVVGEFVELTGIIPVIKGN